MPTGFKDGVERASPGGRARKPAARPSADAGPIARRRESTWQTLRFFLNPVDGRYEDLRAGGAWYLNVCRDFTAGLIVAMIAIPLAMGLAIASGLKPEMGIVGGAIAALAGALFGGSKYQVYGPTAAFIPIIGGLMATFDSQGAMILASLLAGVILCGLGLARLGRFVALVPHSIVVGFTIGIAVVIALSQVGEMLGLPHKLGATFVDKIGGIATQIEHFNWHALAIALFTFAVIKTLIRVSVYIPGPLLALGAAVWLSSTVWSDAGLVRISDRYGAIPQDLVVLTGPTVPDLTGRNTFNLIYFVLAIVFVSAVESLLCSRMADRLADNKGTPYNPDKELWGQGWVQILVPLINGFPHTGALARTAANIKLGAVSPLAGVFKCVLKLLLAYYLASFLGTVPMACIGGLLLYVAAGMVKPAEVRQVIEHNRFHIFLMLWTAVMVVATDFLVGVLSAIALYAALRKFLDVEPTVERTREVSAAFPYPTRRFGRALVGLHCTEQDAGLLDYVSMLVRANIVSEVVCVHVVPDGDSEDDGSHAGRALADMRSLVDNRLGELGRSARVRCELRRGPLLDQLLNAIVDHRCALVILGHRQDHALRRSLARRLAKMAPCSVWFVPDGTPARITRMLVGIDFSSASAHTLQTAAAVAPMISLAEITAVHAYFDESRTTYEKADAVVRGHEAAAFATFTQSLIPSEARIQPLFLEAAHPADAIRRATDDLAADLVVVGTRGRSASAAILLGSVAQETLVASQVPVLVVKALTPQVGLLQAILERVSKHEAGMQFD